MWTRLGMAVSLAVLAACGGGSDPDPEIEWNVTGPNQACRDATFTVTVMVTSYGPHGYDGAQLSSQGSDSVVAEEPTTLTIGSDGGPATFTGRCMAAGEGSLTVLATFLGPGDSPNDSIDHVIDCVPCGGTELTPGVYPTPVEQPWRTTNLGQRFGVPPGQAQLTSEIALLTFAGEVDAGDGADTDGQAVVLDMSTQTPATDLRPTFYAFGLVGAEVAATGDAALLAYGDNGLALHVQESPGGAFDATPVETMAVEVTQAVHAGGGLPSEEIVVASPDLGVAFVRHDSGMGRFALSSEVLGPGQFVGEVKAAYADAPDAPAVVLASSSNSRIYYHPRGGSTTPTQVTDGLSIVNGMRCLPPVCLVFQAGVTTVPVFLFDGQAQPTAAAPVDIGFTPIDAALRLGTGGNVVAAVIGFVGGTTHVAEVELASDGTLVGITPLDVPSECNLYGGIELVDDSAGTAIVYTCVGSHNYVVARSTRL